MYINATSISIEIIKLQFLIVNCNVLSSAKHAKIATFQHFLAQSDAEKLILPIIASRMYNCYFTVNLSGGPNKLVKTLQLVQNQEKIPSNNALNISGLFTALLSLL